MKQTDHIWQKHLAGPGPSAPEALSDQKGLRVPAAGYSLRFPCAIPPCTLPPSSETTFRFSFSSLPKKLPQDHTDLLIIPVKNLDSDLFWWMSIFH